MLLAFRRMRLRVLGSLLLSALVLGACGGADDDGGGETAAATPTPVRCADVDAPAAKPDGGAKKPTGRLDPAKTWTVTFKTSCGSFAIELDVKQAPKTAASFASLAEQGFYDDTIFHRIVPGFVIQGGDPTQRGSGGPGYSVRETPPSSLRYLKGVVAMAKTGAEPAGTSGSQFYVVTGEDAGLPPDYALVGEVSEGMDVVDAIGQLGDASEQPTQPVVVESASVASS